MKTHPFATLVTWLGSVSLLAACTGQGEEGTARFLDPLLVGDAGSLSPDAESPCATCIQQSCGSELAALETELKQLRMQESSAFACVRDSKCLSLFWANRDAGVAAGRVAVEACIASCDVDSGLPARDAAGSVVRSLADGLDRCVDSSCVSQCPGAMSDRDDREAGAAVPFTPALDGAVPRCDGGFPPFDAGFSPLPLTRRFDGSAPLLPPAPRWGDDSGFPSLPLRH